MASAPVLACRAQPARIPTNDRNFQMVGAASPQLKTPPTERAARPRVENRRADCRAAKPNHEQSTFHRPGQGWQC
jgi:hypothetical protein